MEKFVKLTAPIGKIDFVVKLIFFMLIGGGLNHLRHVLTHGFPGNKSFWTNFFEAAFTSLPMCTFALLLIGHLAMLQKRLYQQATRDPLTGLGNRRWFMDNTPRTIKPSQCVMIIDVDHFKAINDTFGHDMGDRCLQMMGADLDKCLGTSWQAARIGGEEFAVFFDKADIETVKDIAANICAGFGLDTGQGKVQRVTSSVGIFISDTPKARSLALRQADQALYQAKSAGRGEYKIRVAYATDRTRQHVRIAV